MKGSFPALVDLASVEGPVVCLAAHPDDETLGCGGTLALLAARGLEVHVVVVADAGVDGERRRAEAREACRILGLREPRFLGLPDGALGAETHLAGRLSSLLDELRARTVFAPSPCEHHPDHRALAAAAASALARGPAREAWLWAVNTPVLDGCLIDVGAASEAKRAALSAHASQLSGGRLERAASADLARSLDVDVPGVERVEAFTCRSSGELLDFVQQLARLRGPSAAPGGRSGVTAVVSTWNKRADLRENLLALEAQTLPFDEIVVVDNASTDGTVAMVRAEFPRVRLVVMPHDRYGACETFNVGFASATTEYTAILDDDIVMQPQWVEKSLARMRAEPESTAIVSTQVVEPGTPESYLRSPLVNSERYMSTFRGCASLAKSRAIREAGWYDINHFIYGNERDLTCRLLNHGWRVLQYPDAGVWHKTPFGIKMGKRSLYYHARNAFLTMLKYAPAKDLARLPFLVLFKVVLRGSKQEAEGTVADATGTIGIGRSLKETPGAWWVLVKACASIAANIPYCWRHRRPCRHPDFELPLS